MDPVQRIQDAEAQVADLQRALGAIQTGLEKAEAIATAAEENRRRTELLIKIAAGLLAVSIVVTVVSRRNASSN